MALIRALYAKELGPMLLRFAVTNHRSIRQRAELSMIAIDVDRPAARRFDLLAERVLTVCGIYGPNASGKSNLLEAVVWLSSAVARSLRSWDATVPREAFKFGDGPSGPSTFEVEMMVGGVRYAYDLTLTDTAVLSETLVSYPERRPRTLLSREGRKLHFRRGLGSLAGTRELLTPTTLALSAAMRFDEPEIRSFGESLMATDSIGVRRSSAVTRHIAALSGRAGDMTATLRLFEDAEPTREPSPDQADTADRSTAIALLKLADLGIDDVELVAMEIEFPVGTPARRVRRPRLIHRVGDEQVPFELAEESEGTRTWFRLIGPALNALSSGQTLLFDEIDASLHPRLSARLVELFQDPVTNPRGAQLIFTTHDTSLLNHLNRDEVWLTEKGPDGGTRLTALAEYGGEKVRRSVNLEKAYLQGRFGAVPDLDQALLRRVLGIQAAS